MCFVIFIPSLAFITHSVEMNNGQRNIELLQRKRKKLKQANKQNSKPIHESFH